MTLRIGLLFTFNPVWMGGIIYLQNIVRTLSFLDEDKRPSITIFHKPELAKFVDFLDYPDINLVEIDYPNIKPGVISSILSRTNRFIDPIWNQGKIDVIFPVQDMPIMSSAKAVAWYADLQHRYYPEFFSPGNRLERELRIRFLLRNCRQLVVSSQAVANDFRRFYRIPNHLRIDLYRFVSPIAPQPEDQVRMILEQYGIRQPFFLVSNQFHKHKNHRVIMQAFSQNLSVLKDSKLVLTGRAPRVADSPYMRELKQIIRKNGAENRVTFLGAIPRKDQTALMQSAVAVVQPSLFEGWSTVIEDAKSLQVPVIASNLPVHYEQLGDSAHYFPPDSSAELGQLLKSALNKADSKAEKIYDSLTIRARAAAQGLVETLECQVS